MCDDSFEFQKRLKTISEEFELFNEEITVKMSFVFPDTHSVSEVSEEDLDLPYKQLETTKGDEALTKTREFSKLSKTTPKILQNLKRKIFLEIISLLLKQLKAKRWAETGIEHFIRNIFFKKDMIFSLD